MLIIAHAIARAGMTDGMTRTFDKVEGGFYTYQEVVYFFLLSL